MFEQLLAGRLLKRGYLLLIGGGVAVAVSIAVLGYYGMRLVEALEGDAKFTIEPNDFAEISQNLSTSGQGAYVVAFRDLGGVEPVVTITGPSSNVVLTKTINQLIILEAFPVVDAGVYVLKLANPSQTTAIEAAAIIDSQEAVLSRAGALSPVITVAFGLMLVAGIGALAAGAVITVIDKRRLNKMKQYGDTSDLV